MDYIARVFWRITKNSQSYMADRLREFGIGTGQYPVLTLLYNREEFNQDEIASNLGLDKTAVTKAVRKLLQTGHITRKTDAKDKRMYRISLTEKALKQKTDLLKIEDDWQEILLNGFSSKEKKSLKQFLKRIRGNSMNKK